MCVYYKIRWLWSPLLGLLSPFPVSGWDIKFASKYQRVSPTSGFPLHELFAGGRNTTNRIFGAAEGDYTTHLRRYMRPLLCQWDRRKKDSATRQIRDERNGSSRNKVSVEQEKPWWEKAGTPVSALTFGHLYDYNFCVTDCATSITFFKASFSI